jgi:hypothetical protein
VIRISFRNQAGELEGVNVRDENDTKPALIELLRRVPFLAPGDHIVIEDLSADKTK